MAMFNPQLPDAATLQNIYDNMGAVPYGNRVASGLASMERMQPINEKIGMEQLYADQELNRHNRTTNPLLEDVAAANARQARGKDDAYFSAERAGAMGGFKKNEVEGRIAQNTEKAETNSKNAKFSLEQRQATGKELLNRLSFVAQLPNEASKKEALAQFASEMPELMKSPQMAQIMKLPSSQIMKFAQSVAQNLMNTDPALLEKLTVGREHNATLEKVGAGHDAASRYAADARKKDINADQLATLRKEAAKGNPEAFLMLSDLAKESGDMMAATRYLDLAQQAKIRREAERRAGAQVPDQFKRDFINGNLGGGNATGDINSLVDKYAPK